MTVEALNDHIINFVKDFLPTRHDPCDKKP